MLGLSADSAWARHEGICVLHVLPKQARATLHSNFRTLLGVQPNPQHPNNLYYIYMYI